MALEINQIIEQEIKHVLNETRVMEHDNFKFRQQVENPKFHNYDGFSGDYDVDITKSDIIINWNIKFWVNQSGIENFFIAVTGVEGNYLVEMYNKQSDAKEQETPKEINDVKIPWKFSLGDATLIKGGSLYVDNLIFNFTTGECQVTFA